ncbi:DgyrCDS866 [Dimorphilus gyrociliatus]|uniref:DgyrCDS866 n=1 Tax=Dimorphilus gyrociliatus TaxID=2664684 RepID=A0A7I8V7N0_9ANNE|nr:DgyrCDS866 [Dimorphilus gyrociliatus]
MSILLTAGKKGVSKPKSAKPKKKASQPRNLQTPSGDPTPPMSTDNTKVWYWMCDDEPTTVMYSEKTGEVWANGSYWDTNQYFSEEGIAIDFNFLVNQTEQAQMHSGRIKRIEHNARAIYELYVDGCMIIEHKNYEASPPANYQDKKDN